MKGPLLKPEEKQTIVKVNGKELKFTNTHKLYWPKEKIRKGDILNYYHEMAPFIMPYLKGRPHSLNRHPDGITGGNFYQKNVAGETPSWIKTYNYKIDGKAGVRKYLVCEEEASLLYMANLGCIEINPWHSTAAKPDYPTWCVIDLDPDTNTFDKVIEVARLVNDVLTGAGVKSYVKTSGSTGIHIYLPLGAKYDYDQSKTLAELVVSLVHHEMPRYTSLERSPAKRKGKIYLDFLQNRSTQTIAAPYSLRPKPGATVSTPLHWDEVKKGLKLKDFTINNIASRVKEVGDLFKPVLGKGVDLKKLLSKLG